MSRAKMQAARELIQAKKYDEARTLLKTIDHPTAQSWLEKLDKISPGKGRRKWPLVLLIVLIAVGVVAFISLKQQNDAMTEMTNRGLAEMDIRFTLKALCPSDITEEACDARVELVMAAARDDIDYCWEQYGNNDVLREDCLVQRGVIPR